MALSIPETYDLEPPSPEEVAEACRNVLGADACDEIAAQESIGEAVDLAFTALTEAGKDPEVFLISKGILEGPDSATE